MSSLDSVATTTLKIGGVAGVATVAVTGFMGVGMTAGLIMNPIGLSVGAGIALLGIYKMLSQPQDRRLREAEAKAEKTVENMKNLCEDAKKQHAQALDELIEKFYHAAESIYSPIAKEVLISNMYCDYQRKVIAEISNNTERYIENLLKI